MATDSSKRGIQANGKPAHHVLEDILAHPLTRRFLGWLTSAHDFEKCFFERLAENYNNPSLTGWDRLKWRVPEFLIDAGLKAAHIDKAKITAKLFHHRPTVRALTVTARSIARYGLSAPQRFDAPLMVVWNLTQACNLRCQHCYQNATPKPAPDELTLEEKLRAVDEMGRLKVPFLAIAGGEPLVSKHLWAVLERARRHEIHTTIATNGTMLTRENVKRLLDAGVKYVEVSIDSLDSREHDWFRGQPGAWQRSIQGIRNSVELGMRTGLAACFTRHNVHTADEVMDFAQSLGCHTFSHFNFIPVGRGRDMLDADLTPAQREWLMQRLVGRMQQGRMRIISTAPQLGRACVAYAPADGIFATGHAGTGPGRASMVLSRYIGGCGAGRCYCAFQPNGDVTPCVYISQIKVGNLRTSRLQEIWDNPLFELLSNREDRRHYCAVCEDRAYCGGCRARALAYTGDIRAGDPGCIRNQTLWESLETEEVSQTAGS